MSDMVNQGGNRKGENMKLQRWFALFFVLLVAPMAWAASSVITTNGTTCTPATNCLVVNLPQDKGGATLVLSGTWTGTIQFEATGDGGVTWVAVNVMPLNATTAVTSATANGTWQVNTAGFTGLRMRSSATMSGSATATITSSAASARSGGGGGGGGTIAPGTTNTVVKYTSSTAAGNGSMTDNGTAPVASPNGLGTGLTGGLTQDMPNAASVGTAANLMACQTAGAYTVQSCATNATDGSVGVAVAGVGTAPGTTGNVSLCYGGKCSVKFDNQTTAGHNAVHSTSALGQLHDVGSVTPTSGVENFLIDSANAGAGTAATIKMLTPDTLSLQTLTKITATAPLTATASGTSTNISSSGVTNSFLANDSGSTTNYTAHTVGNGLSLSGGVLSATGAVSAGQGVFLYFQDINAGTYPCTGIPLTNQTAFEGDCAITFPDTTISEVTDTITNTPGTPVPYEMYMTTALGRTVLDGGTWETNIWQYVGVVGGGRVNILTAAFYDLVPSTFYQCTFTTSGSGTTRTVAFQNAGSCSTPYVAGDYSATLTADSWFITSTGIFPLASAPSGSGTSTTFTITTLSTYTNQTTATFTKAKNLFQIAGPTITNTSPVQLYSTAIAEPQFTLIGGTADSLGIQMFATQTGGGATTTSFTHNGTLHYSNVQTPLAVLHNSLAGLQGCSGGNCYHNAFVGTGTIALGTSSVASGACNTASGSPLSLTGVATTDVVTASPNVDPSGVTGYAPSATGGLFVYVWPSSNAVNAKVCNNTSAAIVPGAMTLNVRVVR